MSKKKFIPLFTVIVLLFQFFSPLVALLPVQAATVEDEVEVVLDSELENSPEVEEDVIPEEEIAANVEEVVVVEEAVVEEVVVVEESPVKEEVLATDEVLLVEEEEEEEEAVEEETVSTERLVKPTGPPRPSGPPPKPSDPPPKPSNTPRPKLRPDLSVMKKNHQKEVEAGERVTWDIVVTNKGKGRSTGIMLTDRLPEFSTFKKASNGGSETSQGLVTWPKFNLKPGESRNFSITVKIDKTVPHGVESVLNMVVVKDDGKNGPDRNPENNKAYDKDRLLAAPDIQVEKTNKKDEVKAGKQYTYSVKVKNVGTQGALDVMTWDKLPHLTTFVSADNGGHYIGMANAVSWPRFDLAAGETKTLKVVVLFDSVIPNKFDTVVNSAMAIRKCDMREMKDMDMVLDAGISQDIFSHENDEKKCEPEISYKNNHAHDKDPLIANPDIVVKKDDGLLSVDPGQETTYKIVVKNKGSRDAFHVMVKDMLPENTTYVSSSNNLGLPDPIMNDGYLMWKPYYHPVGAKLVIKVTVKVDGVPFPAGVESITNTAMAMQKCEMDYEMPDEEEIVPSGFKREHKEHKYRCYEDANLDNNMAMDTDLVNADPEYTLDKDDQVDSIQPGDTIIYKFTYANNGNQHAQGVYLYDVVPVGTTFNNAASVAAGTDGWDCADGSVAGTVCTYIVGDLAVGDGGELFFAVDVLPGLTNDILEILNEGEIVDPSENSSTASETTPVEHGSVAGIEDEKQPEDGSVAGASDTLATTGQNISTSVFVGMATLFFVGYLNNGTVLNLLKRKKQ